MKTMDTAKAFNLPLFSGFNEQQLSQLKHLMEFCSFNPDMVLFEQGSKAEYLYILVSGSVTIRYKPYDGLAINVANILPGNVFGWSAALNRLTYSSGAFTVEDSETIRLKRTDLQTLCQRFPKTGALFIDRLASVISERIKNSHYEILAMLQNNMDINSECWRRINKNAGKKRIHA
jgi:CRP-like cAMP-binding protein